MKFSYWENKTWLSNIDFVVVGSGIVGLNCALELRAKQPKSKIVIWDLNGCMKVVGESVLGAVDAASYNNSIYIADDAGYYWIVGADNKIEKKQIKIATKDGFLIPQEIKVQGKKSMKISDLMNGFKFDLSSKFI